MLEIEIESTLQPHDLHSIAAIGCRKFFSILVVISIFDQDRRDLGVFFLGASLPAQKTPVYVWRYALKMPLSHRGTLSRRQTLPPPRRTLAVAATTMPYS